MMSLKVPCAGPFQKAFKEFEQPWFIERLEPVCQALQDSGILNAGQAVLNNPKQLSLLTAGVLQLQQNILGRQSSLANRKMSVLPESLFRDFGPKGALFTILTETIKYLSRMNVALHTFVKFVQQESLETQSTYMDMLLNIRFELEQRNLLPHYRIHFSRNISAKVVSALSAIVKAHGGEVVTSRHACTHQIFPHPSDDAAAMDQALNEVQRSEHVRILDHKDEIAYTHFCYHPPSYREWLPTTETRGKLEETRPISARWNVCTRFILDLDLFNEWMDEVDYEPESYGEEDSDSADGVAEIENKRKCDFEAAESKKVRIAESELSPPRQLSFANAHNSIAVERVPGLSSESVGGSGTIDTAQGKHVPVEKSDVPIVADATQSTMDGATYATPAHAQPAADRVEPVVVPSYSSWFSFGAVSQVERKQMPDFFENKSPLRNEATYVMIRDFIVKLYRQRPRSHLSVTECRRHIAVDAGAILRIHAFLDHWGLINYDIQPDARPVLLGLSGTGQPVLLHGPYGQQVLQSDGLQGTTASSWLRLSGVNTASACTAGNLASRNCVLTSDTSHDIRNDWNPEETLRLLKAIEEYGHDSWIRVAEAVGTKSAAQCVMQFVRLPIEDPYLDDSLPGCCSQLGTPPVFGQSDSTSDQNGTAFNQFLSRLLEIGKCQDIVAPVNTSSVATGAEVLQSINDSTSGSAAAALAIAQIAARSKILAAREEQIFNQYANEAICLQLKRLEKRIENLQQVESAVVIQGKTSGAAGCAFTSTQWV